MSRESMNRRDFNKLSVAALGGLAAGTAVGCGGGGEDKDKDKKTTDNKDDKKDAGGDKVSGAECWTSGDSNVCRGLNVCKGKGKGDHECAGLAMCASIPNHDCHGQNDCACQGGCHDTAGENACKGKGECAVPLGDETWAKAREKFEAAMKAAEKTFGDAPAKAAS